MWAPAAAACGVVATGIGLRYVINRRRRRRVASLIRKSAELHLSKDYDASLAHAREAFKLAASELPGSQTLRAASLHLAGAFHATNRFDEALSLLDDIEANTAREKDLVPVLHARAEVLEAADERLSLAAAELTRARDIRRRVMGPASMDAAFAAHNLARVLVRQSQEAAPVPDPRIKTRVALMHSSARVLELIERAEALSLEAHGIAINAGEVAQAAVFVGEILDLLKADGDAGAAKLIAEAAAPSVRRLAAAYLETSGEE